MVKKPSKRAWKWILAGAAVAIVAFVAIKIVIKRKNALPEGIASGNGRIEATLVDVSAREALRVKEVRVKEGTLVKPGEVLALMDTDTLSAQLAEANAAVQAAEEKLAVAKANIVKQKSEIDLAGVEENRSQRLVEQGAGSQRELDVRKTKVKTANATLGEAQAGLATATQNVEVARKQAATIQTRIDDATLRSPVVGRVLYRLAEPGEVMAPGGKVLTVVNLDDVYMEIFLPSDKAAPLKIGAESRVTVDYLPKRAIAGHVSYVSPEAQFTPKQVETKSEREKLMFRVKIQLPKEVISQYIERIKTGVRGVGYVKIDDSAVWPSRLQNVINPGPAVGSLTQ